MQFVTLEEFWLNLINEFFDYFPTRSVLTAGSRMLRVQLSLTVLEGKGEVGGGAENIFSRKCQYSFFQHMSLYANNSFFQSHHFSIIVLAP